MSRTPSLLRNPLDSDERPLSRVSRYTARFLGGATVESAGSGPVVRFLKSQ